MQWLIFVFNSNNSWIFALIAPMIAPLNRVWWAQMDFKLIGCYATKWLSPFSHTRPLWDFGGLKWTRTIDLTLIRRVL